MQLLGLPTHPIITQLTLPIGGGLQLNGLPLQAQPAQGQQDGDESGEDGTQVWAGGLAPAPALGCLRQGGCMLGAQLSAAAAPHLQFYALAQTRRPGQAASELCCQLLLCLRLFLHCRTARPGRNWFLS